MTLLTKAMFTGNTPDDTITIKDHFVYRNGKQIPYIPHDKLAGRKTIDVKFFVYHFTSGGLDLEPVLSYLNAKTTQADVHLAVDRDGRLVQMAPLNSQCWHAGQSSYHGLSGLNNYSCGLEVVNPGPMDILGGGLYKSWFGTVYKHDPAAGVIITEAVHPLRGGPKMGWMNYSEAQLKLTTALAIAINAAYGAEIVGHDEITTRKNDPGPVSQIEHMRAMIDANRKEDVAISAKADGPVKSVKGVMP